MNVPNIVLHRLSDGRDLNQAQSSLEEKWPRMRHSTSVKRYNFHPGNGCDCLECPNEAERRIVVNVWGMVMEADVCEGRAEMDGKAVDCLRIGPPNVSDLSLS